MTARALPREWSLIILEHLTGLLSAEEEGNLHAVFWHVIRALRATKRTAEKRAPLSSRDAEEMRVFLAFLNALMGHVSGRARFEARHADELNAPAEGEETPS